YEPTARCKACTSTNCSRHTCSRSVRPGWYCRQRPCSSFDIEWRGRSRHTCGDRERTVRTSAIQGCRSARPDSGYRESAVPAVELLWSPYQFLPVARNLLTVTVVVRTR